MTNCKKTVLRIVIAAVVLSIVAAVCFLVYPKDYGPEVGNPQMLELPGVAWFATPDEVKEALNITEEQVLWENKSSGFVLQMRVTDLTLYGRDVPLAVFEFWFNNNGNTALRKAKVFFSEDTDMNKLKKELMEIYGPGIDEPYRYVNLYFDGTDRKFSDMEASAESEDIWDSVEGNPYRDALADPDYMAHHWLIENSTSTVPEEVMQYLQSVAEVPQRDDAFMEELDDRPWIVVYMANRYADVIFHETIGTENEGYPCPTNNYMIFNAELLAEYLYYE